MKMRRCWGCSRRRPLKKIRRAPGEPWMCWPKCGPALHRAEAQVCRWILGEHDWAAKGIRTGLDRNGWRETLARHIRLARA